jgi:hypothetical protein
MRKKRGESINKKNINTELFNNSFTKESVYILGILWADGHIRVNKSTKMVSINCVEKDMEEIKNVFMKTGDWIYSNPIKKYHKEKEVKTQRKLSTTTWNFYDLLYEYGYNNKENGEITVLDLIPKDLIKYWFRGFLDGDGCIRLGSKYGISVVFAGPLNQNWSFLHKMCENMLINYRIDKLTNKLGGYSHFIVHRKNDVKKILDYIYSDYDFIGLSRKYEKYKKICDYIEVKSKKFWSESDTNFLTINYPKIGGVACSKILNKKLHSIYNKSKQLGLMKTQL